MSTGPSVAIIGAGFGGLAAAVEARRAGIEDIVILDRAERVGGVWEANTYPGAACDVPSHLYSLSFAPNPRWSRRFSPQGEIREYLEQVARDFGLEPLLRLGQDVTRATWDEDAGRWHLEVEGGPDVEADVLVPACGQLTRPSVPDLPGMGDFEGDAFHSAWWDHDLDLRGRRVAVVGTGASAIQFVPAIADEVEHLTVFQRSAPWTLPKPDVAYRGGAQRLYERAPGVQRAVRSAWRTFAETLAPMFTGRPPLVARASAVVLTAMSDLQRRVQLARPAGPAGRHAPGLRDRLQADPHHDGLVPRPAPSRRGPRDDADRAGAARRASRPPTAACTRPTSIIFGTGFTATDFLAPMEVVGREGTSLRADVGRRRAGLLRPDRAALPEHVRDLRAQHRARHRVGDRHAGGAGAVPRRRRSTSSRAAAPSAWRCGPTCSTPSRRSSTSGCARRSGPPDAAAGTSTTPAA